MRLVIFGRILTHAEILYFVYGKLLSVRLVIFYRILTYTKLAAPKGHSEKNPVAEAGIELATSCSKVRDVNR